MSVTLTWQGSTPGQPQFGLATLTEHYKVQNDDGSQITAAAVLNDSGVPQVGDAHPDFTYMFVTDRHCAETGESASALDVIYMGCLTGEGSPDLPVSQTQQTDSVLSATSSKNVVGQATTSPVTVQFYAPTSVLTWITYNAPGVKGTAPDPVNSISIITVTIGDTAFTYTSAGMDELVAAFFTAQLADTLNSVEVVAGGKFWQNTETKVLSLVPYVFDLPPGFYPYPFSSGTGYEVGDSITVTGTGSCTMDVDGVTTGGHIFATTITSNTLSAATGTPISATGGSGSGASYTVIEIT